MSAPYMPFFVSDFLADTQGMSAEVVGAWIRTLCQMWRSESPTVVYKSVQKLVRFWHVDNVDDVLSEIKTVADVRISDDGSVCISSNRMAEELDKLSKRRHSSRKWKEREAEKTRTNPVDVSDTSRNDSALISVLSLSSESSEGKDNGFSAAWNLYEKKVGKVRAEAAWGRLTKAARAAALASIPAYVSATPDRQYRQHFTTWIHGRGWEDEIIDQGDTAHGKSNKTGRTLTARQRGDVSVDDTIAAFDEYAERHGLGGGAGSTRALAEHAS